MHQDLQKTRRDRTWGIGLALAALLLAASVGCEKEEEAEGGNNAANNASTNNNPNNSNNTTPNNAANNTTPNNNPNNNPNNAAPGCVELSDGTCVEETFQNPPVLEPDEDGVYQLSLAPTEVTLDGERHCVRAYNGAFVGPMIDTPARVGDAKRGVRVNLANRLLMHDYRSLSGDTCDCTDANGQACVPEHIHNRCLSADDFEGCVCKNEDGDVCEHTFDFNVTNLHAHGSHVWPDYARGGEACEAKIDGTIQYKCRECGADVCDEDTTDDTCYHSDNVLNAVHPSDGAQYRWDIDEDGTHHTGLQWYHPHIHGTTAIQVASGAAGPWIIRGPLDALPGVAQARERVMLFTTTPLGDNGFQPLADGQSCAEETLTFNDFSTLGATLDQTNILNGVRRPRMITPPGQVERWRILHAGFLDEVWLGLFRGSDNNCSAFSTASADTIKLTQIGRDGLIMPQPYEHEHVFLSPGYRVEAMLGGAGKLNDGETWCLVAARFLQANTNPGLGQPAAPSEPPSPEEILARFDSDGDVVAILNVSNNAGTPTETNLPDYNAIGALAPEMDLGGVPIEQRCASAANVNDPTEIEQAAVLQVGFFTTDDPDPCECAGYNVNCTNFELADRERYPVDRDLTLNAVEHWRVGASFDGHPFHIHINPFLVCPNDNVFDPIPFPHWRDTYLVNTDRKIDLIAQNRMFTGPYVLHCHKLTHEDEGMMGFIRVCDPATDDSCGDYDWRHCDEDDLLCAKARAATDCFLSSTTTLEYIGCIAVQGGPGGVCGPNACGTDDDCDGGASCVDNMCVSVCADDDACPLSDRCQDNLCVPAPCPVPCPPMQTCQHGVCRP